MQVLEIKHGSSGKPASAPSHLSRPPELSIFIVFSSARWTLHPNMR